MDQVLLIFGHAMPLPLYIYHTARISPDFKEAQVTNHLETHASSLSGSGSHLGSHDPAPGVTGLDHRVSNRPQSHYVPQLRCLWHGLWCSDDPRSKLGHNDYLLLSYKDMQLVPPHSKCIKVWQFFRCHQTNPIASLSHPRRNPAYLVLNPGL